MVERLRVRAERAGYVRDHFSPGRESRRRWLRWSERARPAEVLRRPSSAAGRLRYLQASRSVAREVLIYRAEMADGILDAGKALQLQQAGRVAAPTRLAA